MLEDSVNDMVHLPPVPPLWRFIVTWAVLLPTFGSFYYVLYAASPKAYTGDLNPLSMLILCAVAYLTATSIRDLRTLNRFIRRDNRWVFFHQTMLLIYNVVTLLVCYAIMYKIFGIRDSASHEIVQDPDICLYFSMITLTTVGYGDFVPATQVARVLAALQAFSGFIIFAGIVSFFQVSYSRPEVS